MSWVGFFEHLARLLSLCGSQAHLRLFSVVVNSILNERLKNDRPTCSKNPSAVNKSYFWQKFPTRNDPTIFWMHLPAALTRTDDPKKLSVVLYFASFPSGIERFCFDIATRRNTYVHKWYNNWAQRLINLEISVLVWSQKSSNVEIG